MKLSPSVKKETAHIALGVGIGDAIMIAVFAVLKRLDYTVFLGAALGSAAAIGNFVLMGLAVQKAVEDPERAKAIVQGSYGKRMFGMVAVMVLGLVLPCFNKVAVLIPFLLPGMTIRVMGLLGIYKREEKGGHNEVDGS